MAAVLNDETKRIAFGKLDFRLQTGDGERFAKGLQVVSDDMEQLASESAGRAKDSAQLAKDIASSAKRLARTAKEMFFDDSDQNDRSKDYEH